jgi:hypothetical protein
VRAISLLVLTFIFYQVEAKPLSGECGMAIHATINEIIRTEHKEVKYLINYEFECRQNTKIIVIEVLNIKTNSFLGFYNMDLSKPGIVWRDERIKRGTPRVSQW